MPVSVFVVLAFFLLPMLYLLFGLADNDEDYEEEEKKEGEEESKKEK